MWTNPYYGIQHTTKNAAGKRCSVHDIDEWAELLCWYPGCQFSPIRSEHDSADAARIVGEAWLRDTR